MNITELPCRVVGMPNQEYHSLREFDGRSFLHAVDRFGGEAQLWMDKGRSLFGGNSSTTVGSLFDEIVTGVLQGKKFADLVVVPPEDVLGANGSRSTKAYKEWAASQTGIVCSADQRDMFRCMLDAMCGHDAVYSLMQRTKRTQTSVFFEIDGHKLKVRPDAETDEVWWDLKTTSHGWDRIYRSAVDYGYDMQEALYVAGAIAMGYVPFRMPFVFVQTTPPYACRAFYLPEQMVENARERLRSVMEQVRLRRSTGMYMPAEVNEITELEVPKWALSQEEEVVL
jgi:hypothetical protein